MIAFSMDKQLSVYFRKIKNIKLFGFGIVSVNGLGIDILIFISLISSGYIPLIANIFSSVVAVTFGYFVSARYIFFYKGHFLMLKFLSYLVWNVFRILFFSYLIAQLTIILSLYPMISKIIITPFSFYFNFLFMSFLMTGRIKYY